MWHKVALATDLGPLLTLFSLEAVVCPERYMLVDWHAHLLLTGGGGFALNLHVGERDC